jgi:hypothetical protein
MSARSTLLAVLLAVSLTALAGGGYLWYQFAGPGYYSELNAVRVEIERIPQAKITELDGNHDLSLEHIWARIRIEGKGDMKFVGLDRDSFRYTKHLCLCFGGAVFDTGGRRRIRRSSGISHR